MNVLPRVRCGLCFVLLVVAPAGRGGGAEPERTSLVLLTPGTHITGPRDLPSGWTHLVIKSVPRLVSGDLATLPAVARKTATLFRTVLLAEVRPAAGSKSTFVLRRMGMGLCTPVNGKDTVISSATLDTLHVPFGLIERAVLQKAEEELVRGRVTVRTATFALFSAPTLEKTKTGHEAVLLRYALLVNPQTGTLQTLLWSQAADAPRRKALERLTLLPPGLIDDATVDVLAERVLGAIPVSWSFAMAALPQGKSLRTSPAVRQWSLRDSITPAEATRLEVDLRAVLKSGEAL